MDKRPHGGPDGNQPGLRRNRPRSAGACIGWPDRGSGRRCNRRYRRLFDLSLDGVSGTGAGGQFPAGPLPGPELPRTGPGGRDLEGTDRAVSRGRPADLDLRHGTAGRHGGETAGPGSRGNPGAESGTRRRVSLQVRFRNRLGPLWISGMPQGGVWTGSAIRSGAPNRQRRAARANWSASGSLPMPN